MSSARIVILIGIGVAGCARDGGRSAIVQILSEERRAHLETDPSLLASHIADTLVSVADGRVESQTRAQVEAAFEAYFTNATYHAWDDDAPPRIVIAPQGGLAWVVRQVRVDRESLRTGGSRHRERFISAWTATYEKRNGRWQMTSVTSTFVPDATEDRVLAAARRATRRGTDPIETIVATATARGPGDPFDVEVTSELAGRSRIVFSFGTSAAIGTGSRWWRAAGAAPSELSPEQETFVTGHELHALLLAPRSRVANLAYTGIVALGSDSVIRLTGTDRLEGPVEIYYGRSDTLPIGLRVEDHVGRRGPVLVRVGDWTQSDGGGIRLFRSAEFRQGSEVFRYRYTAIEINPAIGDAHYDRP